MFDLPESSLELSTQEHTTFTHDLDDQKIQGLHHEVLANFGRMLRAAEGELQSSRQDPKRQELGLERVQSAHVFMDRLEEFFVVDQLTLPTPGQSRNTS